MLPAYFITIKSLNIRNSFLWYVFACLRCHFSTSYSVVNKLILLLQDKELASLKASLTQFEGERTRLHDMEVKVYSSESEIQKLNKTIELCNKKVLTS